MPVSGVGGWATLSGRGSHQVPAPRLVSSSAVPLHRGHRAHAQTQGAGEQAPPTTPPPSPSRALARQLRSRLGEPGARQERWPFVPALLGSVLPWSRPTYRVWGETARRGGDCDGGNRRAAGTLPHRVLWHLCSKVRGTSRTTHAVSLMSAVERGGLLCACPILLCDVMHCTLGNVVFILTPVP